MLIEDLTLSPIYDADRLSKAARGLARKSDNFYATSSKLEILSRLMRTDPTSSKITDLINELPWHAKTYVLSKVVKVMPDGRPNPSYRPLQKP